MKLRISNVSDTVPDNQVGLVTKGMSPHRTELCVITSKNGATVPASSPTSSITCNVSILKAISTMDRGRAEPAVPAVLPAIKGNGPVSINLPDLPDPPVAFY